MKKFLALTLALCMILALCACGAKEEPAPAAAPAAEAPAAEAPAQETVKEEPVVEAEPVTFNIATSYKEGSDYINIMQKACDEITEKTNGVVNFVIFPSNQLGSTADVTENMLNGSNIMAGLGMANLSGYVKEAAIPGYPYVVNDYTELSNLFNSKWWEGIKEQLINDWNMVPVMCFSVGYRNIIGNAPIKSAADLSGKLFRIGLGAVGQNFVTACGGTPTTTSAFSECYSALQTKLFDLCEADCELLYTSALYEVADYLSVTHHMMNPCMFAVNKDFWDKVPAEYQEIMLQVFDEAGREIWDNYSIMENEWIEKFAEAGTEVAYIEDIDVDSFKATIPAIMELQGVDPAAYEAVVAAVNGNG